MSIIRPSEEDMAQPFWANLAKGRLAFQHCEACGQFRHPPMPVCARCHSFEAGWVDAIGAGTIYSYTDIVHPVHRVLSNRVPYRVVLVDLDEGVRMAMNVEGECEIGARVRIELRQVAYDLFLPFAMLE